MGCPGYSLHLCLTCQGYSLTSVSWPPTILVSLLAWPQVQVLMVAVVVVAVDTAKGAAVGASNVKKEVLV